MPMSAALLKEDLKTAISGVFDIQDPSQLDKVCNAIATAVVTHITSMAVVTVTSVSGVVSGPGVSGPGTGTIA